MKKHQITVWLFIISIFISGFKNNSAGFNNSSPALVNRINIDSVGLPEIIITDATTIPAEKGLDTFEVLVCLSHAASKPVTIEYGTENETAVAGIDYVATSGTLRFEPGEITKWITVLIEPEVAAEADEDAPPRSNATIRIKIKKVVGALVKKQSVILTILKNLQNSRMVNGLSAYYVMFLFKGYTTLGGELKDCPIRRNGKVMMAGILTGNENVDRYDPVLYTGTLFMMIDIDICSVERTPDGSDRFCRMGVAGLGDVDTELELDSSVGYGYIKIHDDPADRDSFWREVEGDCFSQIGEEQQMVPDKSISSVFNGEELPMFIDVATGRPLQKLKKGIYAQIDKQGNVTVIEVKRKIR